MHFGFRDVILSQICHQHVSATHVAIFRVVRTRIKHYYNLSKTLHSLKITEFPVKIHG